MKRGKPLKRSPLKRSGRLKARAVSARPGRDVSVISAYMADHPYCEFEQTGAYTGEDGHQCINGYEPHHTARIKVDDPRILVSLCTACHGLHDEHDPSFVVLCLWVKLHSGLLDFDFLRSKSRIGCLRAYIERDHDWIDDGIRDMRDAVLSATEDEDVELEHDRDEEWLRHEI